ncbi:MAG TPA: MarR family transcriptional regulator [Candidatus Dormibacteraeota bacterium]|nr:MarR family transcriptional regulator [Candidatus Dormibacteraeota bacterium]
MDKLSPVHQKFVLHWGEMGTRWGVNRTVAQVHALLYLSDGPLNAEQIAGTLGVARSNVSTSLRELQGWGIVRLVHVMGDRRAHYESMQDVWEMFRVILQERKRREVDPTLAMLRACVAELGKSGADARARRRLAALLDFFETMAGCTEEVVHLPPETLRTFVKLRGKVRSLLGRLR